MFLVGELLTPMGSSKTPPHSMLDGDENSFSDPRRSEASELLDEWGYEHVSPQAFP